MELSLRFHRGQRDKAGVAYVLHPLTLATKSTDPLVQQAALLHDVLEDTNATVEDLRNAGVSPESIEAVELLTHAADVSYADYVIKLKENAIARTVKLLDLHDNYRLDRVALREDHTSADGARLLKYILTKQYLCDEIDRANTPAYAANRKSNLAI